MKTQIAAALLTVLTFTCVGCSSGPSASEVSWASFGPGSGEYIAAADDAGDCRGIRAFHDYAAMMESEEEPKSLTLQYLQDAYARHNCDQSTTEEYLDDLMSASDGSLPGYESGGTKEDNPFYFGPGCAGLINTYGAFMQPPPTTSFENLFKRLTASVEGMLAALPEEVVKTGSREPTEVEDAGMRLAAAVMSLGDVTFGDDSSRSMEEAQQDIEVAHLQLLSACIDQYDAGLTQPTT